MGGRKQGLIDPNAVYYAQILMPLADDGVYKITGPFPPVRYFSFQVGRYHPTTHPGSQSTAPAAAAGARGEGGGREG